MTVARAGARPAAATSSPQSFATALAAATRQSDAYLVSIDKNKDGFIGQTELKPLMKRLEAVTRKMGDIGDPGDTSKPDVRKALKQSRATMTDGDRMLMAVAQASSTIEDAAGKPQAKVSVKRLQAEVRKTYEQWGKLLTAKDGGLEAALGKMMAAVLLPDALLDASLRK